MSDQLYLFLQVWLIVVLTVVDGGEVLIQHPGWPLIIARRKSDGAFGGQLLCKGERR